MRYTPHPTWIMLMSLIWVIAACGSDDVQVVPIASVPTIAPEATAIIPLPPTAVIPTEVSATAPASTRTPRPTATSIPSATPTPVRLADVVIAVKPIPAGAAIPPDAVQQVRWPVDALPYAPIEQVEAVINEVALVDIGCNEPILLEAIAYREVGTGFEALPDTCPTLQASVEMVDVVIAVEDVDAGTVIAPGAVTLRPWPVGALPSGHHRTLADVIGTVASGDIRREQPITTRRIIDE